jgi:hypothetical protein
MKRVLGIGFLIFSAACSQAMHVPIDDVEKMTIEPKDKAALLKALDDYVVVDSEIWLGWDGKRNCARNVVEILAQHNVSLAHEPVLKEWLKKAFDLRAQYAIVCLQEAGVDQD